MTRIQLRHDTAANFASESPILLVGEVAIETDTNKIKIGDGVTAYNSLEYFGGDIDDLVKKSELTQVYPIVEFDSATSTICYKYSNGYAVQKGKIIGATYNRWYKVNLPYTLSNTNYANVQVTASSNNTDTSYPDKIGSYKNLTTNSVDVGGRYLSYQTTGDIDWCVSGFIIEE